MDCPHCSSANTVTIKCTTNIGYSIHRCRDCCRTFNERTATPFNFIEVPTDILFEVLLCRGRNKISYQDLIVNYRSVSKANHARDRQSTSPNLEQSNNIKPNQNNTEIANPPNPAENDPERSKPEDMSIESKDADNVPDKVKNWSSQALSMGKSKSTEREKLSELDELNAWLSDPILRKEVLPLVINSDKYSLELNEYGEAICVVEIPGD